MSKKTKLTKEEIEDGHAMSAMFAKAKQSHSDIIKEANEGLERISIRKKYKPVILKLHKDKKISGEKKDKYLDYIRDGKYTKLEKLEKKYPEYFKEEESSSSSSSESEDEAEKRKQERKKKLAEKRAARARGDGLKHEILQLLQHF
jgi:hypothetical protein